ncbi:MAG TPA: hypothetical protein VFC09_08490 [Candidatus Dormibacteraeota bacterium]|nr:hypothetical protein [Candidatus Dormibacteraeota bacterium]
MTRATIRLQRLARGRMRLTLAAAGLAVAAAGGAVAIHTTAPSNGAAHAAAATSMADQFGIPGLTDATFAHDGVTLHAPSNPNPAVTKQKAEAAANAFGSPAATVVAAVLADVDSRYMQDGQDPHGFDNPRLCWVVVLKTSTVLAPEGRVIGTFTPSPENMEIAMLDAKTGRIIGIFRDGDMPVIK